MAPVDPTPLRGAGEIAEDEASAELARTYARIAQALRVPFVPTIYRILGRWPGYLEAAVDALGPSLTTPEARAFAVAARGRAARASLPGEPIEAGEDARRVRAVLDRYNTANPGSLLFAAALLPGAPPPPGLMTPGRSVSALPRDAAPAAVLDDVRLRHGGLVLPGVWRELAGFPDLLHDAWRHVRELANVPAYHETRAAVREMAVVVAAAADRAVPEPSAHGVPDEDLGEVAGIVGWFAHGIAAVIVEVEYLRRLVVR